MIPIDELQNNLMIPIMQAAAIQSGGLELYFDKSPDMFRISRMHFCKSRHLGFYDNEKMVGYGAVGFYDALVKGVNEKIYTLYNFYLLKEARGKKIPLLAVRHFLEDALKEKASFGLALTLKGNKATESYVEHPEASWLPRVKYLENWINQSIVFSKPMKNDTGYKVRKATLEDVSEIVTLLQEEHLQRDFGHPFTIDGFLPWLEKRQLDITNYYVAINALGFIQGVCLAWDCSGFRKTRILHYSHKLWFHLLAYHLMSSYWNMADLPEPDESFFEITITDYAAKNRDPAIMHALLVEIYREYREDGFHFMNWGSCVTDPLLKAGKGFWKLDMEARLLFSSFDSKRLEEKMNLPYFDIAFL
jgi:hypothetical protein